MMNIEVFSDVIDKERFWSLTIKDYDKFEVTQRFKTKIEAIQYIADNIGKIAGIEEQVKLKSKDNDI